MGKRLFRIGMVLSTVLLTSAPIHNGEAYMNGNCCPQYNECSNDCGACDWYVGADFIYLKPCIDNLDYCLRKGPNTPVDPGPGFQEWKNETLCTGWEPGFRVWVGSDDIWCGWSLRASYTWLNISTKSSVDTLANPVNAYSYSLSSPLLIDFKTPNHASKIAGDYDTSYNEWDIQLGLPGCYSTFQPYVGVQGLIFNQEFDVNLTDHEDAVIPGWQVKWTSDYSAVGLKVGTGYQRCINECFSFFTDAAGAVVVGNTNAKHDLKQYNESTKALEDHHVYKNTDTCNFVPGFKLQVGLEYSQCICNLDASFRVGYEFTQWFNLSSPRRFTNSRNSELTQVSADNEIVRFSSNNSVNMGLHGLFVGGEVKF